MEIIVFIEREKEIGKCNYCQVINPQEVRAGEIQVLFLEGSKIVKERCICREHFRNLFSNNDGVLVLWKDDTVTTCFVTTANLSSNVDWDKIWKIETPLGKTVSLLPNRNVIIRVGSANLELKELSLKQIGDISGEQQ